MFTTNKIKTQKWGEREREGEEMAQVVKALMSKPDDLCFISKTHKIKREPTH